MLFIGVLTVLISLSSRQEEGLEASKARGKQLYDGYCAGCHKPDGTGYVERRLTPPLAQSDYLLQNKVNGIQVLLFGLKGKVTVNGLEYDRQMPAVDWSDQQISDVLNYVRNSWSNSGAFISKAEVTEIRDKGPITDK